MGFFQRLTGLCLVLGLQAGAGARAARALESRSDARVDLMGLVELLAGGRPGNRELRLSGLAVSALERFDSLRGHAAVRRMASLRGGGFAGNIPAQYGLYLSQPPELREVLPAPEHFALKAGGREALAALREDLGSFARESGFLEWRLSQSSAVAAMEELWRRSLAQRDLEGPLLRYLGLKPWKSWTVVPSPFFPDGGSSAWIMDEAEDLPEVYVVVGPRPLRPEKPLAGGSLIAAAVWPEAVFVMAYIIYEACRPRVRPSPRACSGTHGLGDPESCIKAVWVRGVIAELLGRAFGPADEKLYRRYQPLSPFDQEVRSALLAYSADRERYPDLALMSSRLMAPFQADRKPPECRLVDPARFPEASYSRYLGYYLNARIERGPEAEMLAARADLGLSRGRREGALRDLQEALELAPLDWPRRRELEERLAHLRRALP